MVGKAALGRSCNWFQQETVLADPRVIPTDTGRPVNETGQERNHHDSIPQAAAGNFVNAGRLRRTYRSGHQIRGDLGQSPIRRLYPQVDVLSPPGRAGREALTSEP